MAKGRKTGGRQKGTPNKVSSDLKGMILAALHNAGASRYLADRAMDQPAAFLSLLGRVLPTTLAGDPNAPVAHVHRIELVPVDPKPTT